jgi:hypothetical protein
MIRSIWYPIYFSVGLIQLLSALPVGHGGLTCLALGLFHPYKKVRFAVADLLERIDEHPVNPQYTRPDV